MDRMVLDEHALAEGGDFAPVGAASAQTAMSSAHLNPGDENSRRREDSMARTHLEQGPFTSDALRPDGYMTMVRFEPPSLAQRNKPYLAWTKGIRALSTCLRWSTVRRGAALRRSSCRTLGCMPCR